MVWATNVFSCSVSAEGAKEKEQILSQIRCQIARQIRDFYKSIFIHLLHLHFIDCETGQWRKGDFLRLPTNKW